MPKRRVIWDKLRGKYELRGRKRNRKRAMGGDSPPRAWERGRVFKVSFDWKGRYLEVRLVGKDGCIYN